MNARLSTQRSTPWTRALLPLAVMLALGASKASAQVPKLDLSFQLGLSEVIFAPRSPDSRAVTTAPGLQFGFGARVRHRKRFFKTELTFRYWVVEFTRKIVEQAEADPAIIGTKFVGFSLDVPWVAGYIPYKSPLFKVFLYGGYVNQFNLKFRVILPDDRVAKVRVGDAKFPIYQAMARAGAAFDLALFNFDMNYSIGLNSATTGATRTNMHVIQANLGMLF